MLRPFLVLGFLSAATGACADPVPLTADDLRGLAGSLVEIDTPLGTKLPIRFGKDGLVSAEAGELAPLLGSKKDRGRWWVDGDKLCSKWFRWFDAKPRCITVAQDGTRLHWRQDDGDTGTATLVEAPAPKEDPAAKRAAIVVADAEPAAKTPAAKSPAPVALRTPDPVAVQPTPVPEAVPEAAPIAVAEAAAPKPPLDDNTMMRFGGAGLLEASARVGSDGPANAQGVEPAALAPAAAQPPGVARVDDALSPLRREARSAAKPAPAPAASATAVLPPPVAKAPRVASADVAKAEAVRAAVPKVRAAHPPAMAPQPLYRVSGVHRSDVLNVRRGPAETHATIASIPSTGRGIAITGRCEKDWCPIRYGRVRGWVNSFYLVAEGSGGASSQSQVYLARP